MVRGGSASITNAYFGDLHTHTNYSFDAFMNGTRNTPDDAYRHAKGEALMHPAGFEVQLDRRRILGRLGRAPPSGPRRRPPYIRRHHADRGLVALLLFNA